MTTSKGARPRNRVATRTPSQPSGSRSVRPSSSQRRTPSPYRARVFELAYGHLSGAPGTTIAAPAATSVETR